MEANARWSNALNHIKRNIHEHITDEKYRDAWTELLDSLMKEGCYPESERARSLLYCFLPMAVELNWESSLIEAIIIKYETPHRWEDAPTWKSPENLTLRNKIESLLPSYW